MSHDKSYEPIPEFTLLAIKISILMREGKIKTKADMEESLKFILMELSKRHDSNTGRPCSNKDEHFARTDASIRKLHRNESVLPQVAFATGK